MSSSDNDSESERNFPPRLGDCEVCAAQAARYTCPKCEVKTCCLACVRIHKKELECDGIRDRTKFIRMKDFTDTDLLSDYRMLEECARFVYGIKKDEKKRFTRIDKDLPIHLFKLKMACRKRGTVLQFLTQNFTRHAINTTRYNFKTNIIFWRVEWIFPNVDTKPLKFIDEKCSEQTKLSMFLDKYLNVNAPPFEGSKALNFYRSAGFSGIKVLLKAEKIRGSAKKFFELDLKETLGENLSGKCVVEFPIIFIVLKDHAYNFEIVTPEDEFNYEEKKEHKDDGDVENDNKKIENHTSDYENRKRPRQLLTEKIAKQKEMEIEKELKEEKKKRPKNLLFTTGYSSEESILSSDSDNESNNKK
ncbi:box C/D snoRNA protein 1 [Battus philenor]|uniref:box C/D snoRNA protein 1 n=1 Tax=Battus philenor TaxID=42288 RepID=UPI0035D09144